MSDFLNKITASLIGDKCETTIEHLEADYQMGLRYLNGDGVEKNITQAIDYLFAAAVQDRFNNPFVNHELMSISLNSTAKWRARNMPSFLEYIEAKGQLPKCLTMSFAAYIAFFSNDIQELNEAGLVCRRPKGNTYTCIDDRWVLEHYYAHRNDSVEEPVHSVMTNTQMWGRDLTQIEGFEALTVKNVKLIREQGAIAAYASCL